MNIDRVNRVDNGKGSLDSSIRFNKIVSKEDSVKISVEAQNKMNSEKINEVKKRLDLHIKDGHIEENVLDHISDRIINDLYPSIKKK